MGSVSSMLPVLLPIALFVLTLIIIFTLRASDKRNKSLSTVKRLLDMYKSNVEASDNSFKQYASELEQTVAKKDSEVKALIQTVIAQTNELKSYSDDLVRLKSAMATYQAALDGLAVLTHEADDKVQTVQNEVDRLDKIRDVIDGFRQDMKDADEHLRKHEQRVVQLERESIGRMNDAVSETDSSMDEAMAGLHRESDEVLEAFKEKTTNDTEFRLRKLDDAFQAVIHTVQQFFGELENKIEEARAISDKLNVPGAAPVAEQSTSDVPKMVVADISTRDSEPRKADFSSEIAQLSEPVPENAEKKPEVVLPKFKAPKFTPKTDDEFEQEAAEEDLAPEEENTYGEGTSETDDFASFGGVEDESDLRGMDIMDMDFKSFNSSREASNRWTKGTESNNNKWETYGDEEVVEFDDK